MPERMKVMPHDWSAFVDRNLFEQLLVSAAGVPITYLLVSGSEAHPEWLVLNPVLSLLCFCFAFLRVWKSAKEEYETSEAWESLEDALGRPCQRLDLVIEPIYIFSLFLMPFFSVSFQIFAGITAVFYITDLAYNGMMLHALPRYYQSQAYNETEKKRCPVRQYLRSRQVIDVLCFALIITFGTAAWWLALDGGPVGSLWAGFACIMALLLIEGLVEPLANIDFHYYREVPPVEMLEFRGVNNGQSVSDNVRRELDRIHTQAFPEEERHFDVEFFLKNTGREGFDLKLLVLDGSVIGYFFYQMMPSRKIVVFWYLAIDDRWRNHGFGKSVIRRMLDEMESHPAPLQYAFLESRSPEIDATHDDIDRRRIALYRSLGAHWIRGVDYAIPSHTDPQESIRYELMFFPIAGHIDIERIKQAVRAIADDTYAVGDPRAAKFEISLAEMYIQPPPRDLD